MCSQSVHIFFGFTIKIITHFPRIFIIFFTTVRCRLYRVMRLEIIGEANTNNFLVGGEIPNQKHLHHRWAEDCILASPQCPSNYGFYDKYGELKKTLLHFMNTTCDESHYYKHSVVKGRCKHNCKFYHNLVKTVITYTLKDGRGYNPRQRE